MSSALSLGQSLPHRLRRELVRRPVLPAAAVRQPGHGAGRQPRRARAAAADGAQALPLHQPADGAGAGARPVCSGWATASAAGRAAAGCTPSWLLVVAAIGYHHACRALLRKFEQFANRRSERWFRVFNESGGAAVRRDRRAGGRQAVLMRRRHARATAARPRRWRWLYAALVRLRQPVPVRRLALAAGRWRSRRCWLLPWPRWLDALRRGRPTCSATCRSARWSVAGARAQRPARAGARWPPALAAGAAVVRASSAAELPAAARAVAASTGRSTPRGAAARRAAGGAGARAGRASTAGSALRDRWFVARSAGALALLLLWPLGLLFPTPVPLGLGQVGERLRELARAAAATDTPWAERGARAAGRRRRRRPHAAARRWPKALVIALGLLAPCLVAYAVDAAGLAPRGCWRSARWRSASAATTLSTALNFGPEHALAWLTPADAAGARRCGAAAGAGAGAACRARVAAGARRWSR